MKNKKHLLTASLASLIIVSSLSASVMSGCGCSNSATPDTAVKTTEIVTEIVENTYYVDDEGNKIIVDEEGKEFIVDDKGNVISEVKDNDNKTDKNESSNSSSSQASAQSSNAQSSEKPESSEKSESSEPNENSQSSKPASSSSNNNPNKDKVLSVDGSKFNVGDTITCTYKLTTPEVIENYEGSIKYDSDYLEVKSARLLSPATSGGILNFKLKNEIKFNGSNISGAYDYTESTDFMVVTYEVKSGGSTSVSEDWIVITGVSQKPYVENGKLVNGAKITKTYSK